MDLSILIASRNEMFLKNTVDNLLNNIRGNTNIIVVLDGKEADQLLHQDKKVNVIYNAIPIGQRASINQAARVSKAKYVMKLDAHCSVDTGFDVKMMADMQDDWTMLPKMYNLHAFDWVCECGKRRYQGRYAPCECGKEMTRDIKWRAKPSPETTSMRFDRDLKFGYFGAYKKKQVGYLVETMSILGACFMLTRDKFFELNICDEVFGSWGSQGTEVSCKTWLSGGRVIVNKKTWFSHMFRTQGGDFGFPYFLSQKAVSHAKKRAQDLFLKNTWDKQIYPLSWLVEKFSPVPGWSADDLAKIARFNSKFPSSLSTSNSFANRTNSLNGSIATSTNSKITHAMPTNTMTFSSSKHILSMGNKSEVERIATSSIGANDMVKFEGIGDISNKPSIHKTRKAKPLTTNSTHSFIKGNKNLSVSSMVESSSPVPTSSNIINVNFRKDTIDSSVVESRNSESLRHGSIVQQSNIISKGAVYYTDNKLDKTIMEQCQKSITIPVVSVSLKTIKFGKNIVLDRERGYLTMFLQILAGLEASDAEVIFLTEHDCLYHKSHFDFIPIRKDVFYYNINVWKLDYKTGKTLHYDCQQTSGLCAYRSLLLQHYRKRVDMVNRHGFSRRMGFEPGTHSRSERVDDFKAESWESVSPNIDIRHENNLTPSRWRKEEFRNQKYTAGWIESEIIPSWGSGLELINTLN